MKKTTQIVLVLMATVMLAGCAGENELAEQGNSVQIAKDGSISSTLVNVLDQSYYDAEELKNMIETEISEVNITQGEDAVVLDDYKSDSAGNVKAKIKYADSEAYTAFNGETFYSGDAVSAKETYGLSGKFLDVTDGKITTEDAVISEDAKIVILSENINVVVPGKIVAITDNVEITGKKSASVSLKSEEDLAYIAYK